MPKRILHILGSLDPGGIELMLMTLYRAIDKSVIQFDFVIHHSDKIAFRDEIESMGGKVYLCPPYTIVNHVEYVRWWNNFFNSHPEYKIVHSHIDSCAPIHLRIAKKRSLFTIMHSHSSSFGGGISGIAKRIININFNKVPQYRFACSEISGRWLYGKKHTFHIFKNAIPSQKFIYDEQTRLELRENLGIKNDFVLIHVGAFRPVKNHNYLLEILNSLLQQQKNAKLLLVGDGELRNEIEEKAKLLGVFDKIIITGFQQDTYRFLQAGDCFVFPSFYEGLPLAVVEAQAAGLPCVISDVISDETAVTDLITKLPINVNPQIWCDAILSAKNTKRKNMHDKIVASGYDVESTVEWLSDFYLSLLSNTNTPFKEEN